MQRRKGVSIDRIIDLSLSPDFPRSLSPRAFISDNAGRVKAKAHKEFDLNTRLLSMNSLKDLKKLFSEPRSRKVSADDSSPQVPTTMASSVTFSDEIEKSAGSPPQGLHKSVASIESEHHRMAHSLRWREGSETEEAGPSYNEGPRLNARPTTAPHHRPRPTSSKEKKLSPLTRPRTAPNVRTPLPGSERHGKFPFPFRRTPSTVVEHSPEARDAGELKNTAGTHSHSFGIEHHHAELFDAKSFINQNVLKKRVNVAFARQAFVTSLSEI